ncbi:secreted aspartic proteinase precursor [Camillea tinctor]|nr:secreted aspartic proteinase precursor [Camillea tinctor]
MSPPGLAPERNRYNFTLPYLTFLHLHLHSDIPFLFYSALLLYVFKNSIKHPRLPAHLPSPRSILPISSYPIPNQPTYFTHSFWCVFFSPSFLTSLLSYHRFCLLPSQLQTDMAYLTRILVCLAFWVSLFTVAASSPALEKASTTKKTISIPLAHNASVPRHGPSEYLRTLKKFNLDIPERLQQVVDEYKAKKGNNKAAPGSESSIPAISQGGDLMWLSPAGIGTPAQPLNLNLDTGSTDTWVFSSDTNPKEVEGQALWNPKDSSTARLIDNCTWSIIYGDFSTSRGICYQDTFTLGDLAIPGMTIESATDVSDMFTESAGMSGLVGLGWPALKQTKPPQKSLLEFLPEVLEEPVFTVDFQHNSTGSFNFGFIDDKLHTDAIQYIKVDNLDGYWGVKATAFSFSGSDLLYTFSTPKNVIVDTGSTLLFAPTSAVETYFDQVPGSNFSYADYGYVVPCNAQLPDFEWELSDDDGNKIQGAVPGAYLMYAHTTNTTCYAGLQSLDSVSGIQGIYGDMFLKSGFVVFDIGGARLGVAHKNLNISNDKRDEDSDSEDGDSG